MRSRGSARSFIMRTTLSLAAALLVGTAVMAAAQSQTPAQDNPAARQTDNPAAQRSEQVAPMHTVPPPAASNPSSAEAENAKPGSVGPSQAATPGGSDTAEIPGATRQTMPSTVSAENAAQDKLPTMAFAFPLSDEQKRTIAASVKAMPKTNQGAKFTAQVADMLPPGTPLNAFSDDVTQKIPGAADYKYVSEGSRILIVSPANGIVVGEIAN
jgi:cytoskeletal protein RodZ